MKIETYEKITDLCNRSTEIMKELDELCEDNKPDFQKSVVWLNILYALKFSLETTNSLKWAIKAADNEK